MRAIRTELRRSGTQELSVPQFRILTYLNHAQDSSLTAAADYLGLTLPSMSKMIDGMVVRRLVTRQTCTDDRRRVSLALTGAGKTLLDGAVSRTLTHLAGQVSSLPPADRETLWQAMQLLQTLFQPDPTGKISQNPSESKQTL